MQRFVQLALGFLQHEFSESDTGDDLNDDQNVTPAALAVGDLLNGSEVGGDVAVDELGGEEADSGGQHEVTDRDVRHLQK